VFDSLFQISKWNVLPYRADLNSDSSETSKLSNLYKYLDLDVLKDLTFVSNKNHIVTLKEAIAVGSLQQSGFLSAMVLTSYYSLYI